MQLNSMGETSTDWGAIFTDVAKAAAGAYVAKSQIDLQKTAIKVQSQAPNYGLPMPGYGGYNYPINYNPQYSPGFSSGGSSGSMTTILLLGLGAVAVFLLLSGDRK